MFERRIGKLKSNFKESEHLEYSILKGFFIHDELKAWFTTFIVESFSDK